MEQYNEFNSFEEMIADAHKRLDVAREDHDLEAIKSIIAEMDAWIRLMDEESK